MLWGGWLGQVRVSYLTSLSVWQVHTFGKFICSMNRIRQVRIWQLLAYPLLYMRSIQTLKFKMSDFHPTYFSSHWRFCISPSNDWENRRNCWQASFELQSTGLQTTCTNHSSWESVSPFHTPNCFNGLPQLETNSLAQSKFQFFLR